MDKEIPGSEYCLKEISSLLDKHTVGTKIQRANAIKRLARNTPDEIRAILKGLRELLQESKTALLDGLSALIDYSPTAEAVTPAKVRAFNIGEADLQEALRRSR